MEQNRLGELKLKQMATLAGFEPRVFALRMQRPEPLDEKVKKFILALRSKILDKMPVAVQAQIAWNFKSRRGIDKICDVNFMIWLKFYMQDGA